MADMNDTAWKNGFHGTKNPVELKTENLFSKGRMTAIRDEINGMWAAGKPVKAVTTGTGKGLKYLFLDKPLDLLTGSVRGGASGAKIVTKIPGFKLGAYAAAGAAGVGLIAYLANSGKKKVSADDVELPPMDTIATANFDAPTMLAEPPKTLMGLEPVEGEHVSRLGKSGQQSFRDIAPPRAALDAGFEDISTVPTR